MILLGLENWHARTTHRPCGSGLWLRLGVWVTVALLATAPAWPADTLPQPSSPVQSYADYAAYVDSLTAIVLARNPLLQSADYRTVQTMQEQDIVRALDPPQLAVDFFQAPRSSFPNPFRDQMEVDYSIQQMLPFPGRITAMLNSAGQKTKMSCNQKETVRLDLVQRLKSAYAGLYGEWRGQEVNLRSISLAASLLEIVRNRYATGLAGQSDVLRVMTELASLRSDSITLEQGVGSMTAMVNALLNRATNAPIERAPQVAPPLFELKVAALCSLALGNRPEFRVMDAEIAMADAEQKVARRDLLPDFMVRGMYKDMLGTRDDFWSLMLGMTLPVSVWSYRGYTAKSEKIRFSIEEKKQDLADMRNMIFAEIADAVSQMNSSRARIDLYRSTTIPLAQQTYDAVMASYRGGGDDILMALDARKMHLMATMQYHMAVVALLKNIARLERNVGLPIESIALQDAQGEQ
jgi:cobalt-zinc-cadmium efflux system outer membrane protein